jgi:sirohydrochlorin ferrochelatase
MNGLIVIAHGSRRQESNQEVMKLVELLQQRNETNYDIIATAFLELAQPSIQEAVDKVVEAGASSITILPYFLAAGVHVVKDIPEIIDEKTRQYPEVDFKMTEHIGTSRIIIEALQKLSRV